ncbi:TetR/AcrR family transcriptional regulator [Actinophytocola sp.]|uniref:TetR/AcrR family transcriptional regulator n=1 Tax=Actinophytocola sp. TaxID=1872138 RepID=UPI00389ACBEE
MNKVHRSWAESVETHRRDIREAILDATAAVVAEHGLNAVTMPAIAAKAGMAKARLYTHFSDLEAIMRAWHDRQIANHLAYLDDVAEQSGAVMQRLGAVLRAYAAIVHQTHEHHATERGASLHRGEGLVDARRQLHDQIRVLISEGARSGEIRDDVTPDELAEHCLRTLSTAGGHSSTAAIRHLIAATLAQLQPSHR